MPAVSFQPENVNVDQVTKRVAKEIGAPIGIQKKTRGSGPYSEISLASTLKINLNESSTKTNFFPLDKCTFRISFLLRRVVKIPL